MKRLITAIGNENLNQKLKKENNIEIVTEDIQYKEGILEILEKDNNIDYIILSELLPGEIEIKKLIEKIKIINPHIQIIIFLENENKELENYLYAKGINSIFYNNQIKISEIINLIKNEEKNINQQLKKELEELKQILLEKENEKNKKHMQKINNNNQHKEKLENNKTQKEIICISGTSRSWKKYIFC